MILCFKKCDNVTRVVCYWLLNFSNFVSIKCILFNCINGNILKLGLIFIRLWRSLISTICWLHLGLVIGSNMVDSNLFNFTNKTLLESRGLHTFANKLFVLAWLPIIMCPDNTPKTVHISHFWRLISFRKSTSDILRSNSWLACDFVWLFEGNFYFFYLEQTRRAKKESLTVSTLEMPK